MDDTKFDNELFYESKIFLPFTTIDTVLQLQLQLIKTYVAQFSMEHDQMRFRVG